MTDLEFLDGAELLLRGVEARCDAINDATEVDIDNQRVGGMITMTFADRSQIVINLQKPLHEVWLAAKSGGFHFRCHEGQWVDTKSGAEFHSVLSRCATDHAGSPLLFAAQA